MTSDLKWHRLSPISVLFFLGKVVSRLLKDALPGLAPLAVVIFNSDDKAWLTSLIVVGVLGLIITSAILQYLFFQFQIQADKVLINEGVLKRNHRILSFERIQNINIIQPAYFRPFSLVTLQLETAGSKSNEANLAGINSNHADEIKAQVLSSHQEKSILSDAASVDNLTPNDTLEEFDNAKNTVDTIATADIKQLVKYGLTSNAMFWFLVVIAPLFGMMDDVLEKWIGEEGFKSAAEFFGGGVTGSITLVVLIILGLISSMLIFSILGSIFRYYRYRLTLTDDTLKRHSGLLNTHEESAKLAKIQAFVSQTNFIGKRLKVENVILKQASGQTNQQNARSGLFVIPTRTAQQSNKLLSMILSLESPLTNLRSIDRRYILKTWSQLMVIPLLLSILLAIVSESYWPFLILLVGLLIWPLVVLRWKNFGYQLASHFATLRTGFVGFRKITFPLFKVQRVEISQSLIQKRSKLATLKLFLASDRVIIPYIPYDEAMEWFDHVSYQIEMTDKSWF
ncbi:PH domain-containing protein [Aliikangiella coralliicola]|uniref:PH domain-containing protein n=1 Tax=Aliikangiella coralliicola TaxID=2592383 RepID=A0A545U4R6_9GAMM|nr:PH domain-containing protein [Aliikangiella coralliicola]TQV84452.1 PH domain-containing protein [Aliikangiella coralliicola]